MEKKADEEAVVFKGHVYFYSDIQNKINELSGTKESRYAKSGKKKGIVWDI